MPWRCLATLTRAIGSGTVGMNRLPRKQSRWTQPKLDATQREFLAQLPLTFEADDRLFVHASAHQPHHWEYVASIESASRSFMATRSQSTFCGHVHVPQLYHLSATGKIAGFQPVQAVEIPLLAQRRWLAVIGAIGQPRDYNPAACYGALDTERNVLVYVRVPYDNETAARKVREAGLPEVLSLRLIEELKCGSRKLEAGNVIDGFGSSNRCSPAAWRASGGLRVTAPTCRC